MRPLLHTSMHVFQSPKCLNLDLSRLFPHTSIQNVFMLHSFHSIYTFSSCPSWQRRPLSRNLPMSRRINDCFMSIFYPFVTLTCICTIHLFHTHTRRSASVHSISIDRVLLCHHVHCSVHWFHPPVSASLHPSSFRPATHLFFHLRWKNLRLFQNVSNLSVSHPLSSPLQSSISSSSHLCFIHISMYLSWIGFPSNDAVFRPFSPSFCTPHPPKYLNQCTMRTSFHPFFTPTTHLFFHSCWKTCICSIYLCIDLRLVLVFHPMCFVSSILPWSLHPPSKISHIYLSHVHIFFFYWHQPSIFPSIHSWSLYVIHKSIYWCVCLVLGFPSNDSITFHIKVSHISLLPKTCHWTFFIPFFKPIFMLSVHLLIHRFCIGFLSIVLNLIHYPANFRSAATITCQINVMSCIPVFTPSLTH